MSLATRILALISVVLSSAALALFAMDALIGFTDIDLRGYLFILPALLAVPVALSTFIIGMVALAQRRKFGWMIALAIVFLLAIATPFVVGAISPSFMSQPAETNVACRVAPPPPPECQHSAADIFWASAPQWAFLGGPFLIGFVALLSTFRAPQAARSSA